MAGCIIFVLLMGLLVACKDIKKFIHSKLILSLKDRLLSAIKSGGIETVKVLTNNPFVSIPLETVKGWLEAEPQK
jgi:hypothetical protein